MSFGWSKPVGPYHDGCTCMLEWDGNENNGSRIEKCEVCRLWEQVEWREAAIERKEDEDAKQARWAKERASAVTFGQFMERKRAEDAQHGP